MKIHLMRKTEQVVRSIIDCMPIVSHSDKMSCTVRFVEGDGGTKILSVVDVVVLLGLMSCGL
jgi:hypothetical protein